MDQIKFLVDKLGLEPHPEGGFYRETYRSEGLIKSEDLGQEINGNRNYSTCIYFLLTADSFSAFHKIRQDEIWHFYSGDPIELHIISNDGEHEKITIGSDLEKGQQPQFVVPGGSWFAARVKPGGAYALVGCTVSPGFDFQDFEMADPEILIKDFPQHKGIITEFRKS